MRYQFSFLKLALVLGGTSGALLLSVPSFAIAASDKASAVVVDVSTGQYLFSDNPNAIRYPASLTKMMTLYMTFDALKRGKITMNTVMPVSKFASSRAPSKLGLKAGSELQVKDAVLGLVTKSANDAATTLAEYLGNGSEASFCNMMTAKAQSIGMTSSQFQNASGLPNPNQRTTARDMAVLGVRLMRDFPEYYPLFSTKEFNYKGAVHKNHNKLLGTYEGTDGIKTGYIGASGFNLVASVKRGPYRLIGVVFGGNTGAERDRYMKKILDNGFDTLRKGGAVASASNPNLRLANANFSSNRMATAGLVREPDMVPNPAPSGGRWQINEQSRNMEPVENPAEVQAVVRSQGEMLKPKPSPHMVEQDIQEGFNDGSLVKLSSVRSTPNSNSGSSTVPDIGEIIDSQNTDSADIIRTPNPVKVASLTPPPTPVSRKVYHLKGGNGTWSLQLGVFHTQDGAERYLTTLQNKYNELFTDKETNITLVSKGKSKIYRLEATGYLKEDAEAICDMFKPQKRSCSAVVMK